VLLMAEDFESCKAAVIAAAASCLVSPCIRVGIVYADSSGWWDDIRACIMG
jgi:hypothetical protein